MITAEVLPVKCAAAARLREHILQSGNVEQRCLRTWGTIGRNRVHPRGNKTAILSA